MTRAQWALIGHWSTDMDAPEVDFSVAHAWTGVHGVACQVEDYALVRTADDAVPRCPTCVFAVYGVSLAERSPT